MTNYAKIQVNISGTNNNSFNSIIDIGINLIAAPTALPVLNSMSVDSYSGGAAISF